MKKYKLLPISFIVLSLFSCTNTPEKRAERLAKEWMKENLKDPSSYKPIFFGKLDSTCIDPIYRKLYEEGGAGAELIKSYEGYVFSDSLSIEYYTNDIKKETYPSLKKCGVKN
ncbi:MAG: hypothetical protein FWF53_06930 [Candidatus Azobacteroides sp.]|nr:hypothetical protein [Candidatus Azobacteroides sp.]